MKMIQELPDAKAIGIKFRMLRVKAQMNQETLAKALGVTQKTIYFWESGKNMPNTEILLKLCHLTGDSLAFFDPH